MAPALRREKRLRQKVVLYSYVKLMRQSPVKRLLFPTVPLLYAKDQCEALSEGEIDIKGIVAV